jgi:hypothetical protein
MELLNKIIYVLALLIILVVVIAATTTQTTPTQKLPVGISDSASYAVNNPLIQEETNARNLAPAIIKERRQQ